MTRYLRNLFIALATMVMSGNALAAADPIYTTLFSNAGAGGYDVVAYFTESKPVEGKDKFQTEHLGADWYFSSQANLDAFKSDPDKYLPQYGGYCAWALSEGSLAKGDPNHWTVLDGKLYLNYDAQVQNQWNADRDQHISRANQNWPTILENN